MQPKKKIKWTSLKLKVLCSSKDTIKNQRTVKNIYKSHISEDFYMGYMDILTTQ